MGGKGAQQTAVPQMSNADWGALLQQQQAQPRPGQQQRRPARQSGQRQQTAQPFGGSGEAANISMSPQSRAIGKEVVKGAVGGSILGPVGMLLGGIAGGVLEKRRQGKEEFGAFEAPIVSPAREKRVFDTGGEGSGSLLSDDFDLGDWDDDFI